MLTWVALLFRYSGWVLLYSGWISRSWDCSSWSTSSSLSGGVRVLLYHSNRHSHRGDHLVAQVNSCLLLSSPHTELGDQRFNFFKLYYKMLAFVILWHLTSRNPPSSTALMSSVSVWALLWVLVPLQPTLRVQLVSVVRLSSDRLVTHESKRGWQDRSHVLHSSCLSLLLSRFGQQEVPLSLLALSWLASEFCFFRLRYTM